MHIIITPSFNQLDYLRRCMASIRDQVDACSHQPLAKSSISVHHHIQDGGSTDGTVEFLEEYQRALSNEPLAVGQDRVDAKSCQLKATGYTFSFASEADDSMYDALNKGVAFVGNRHEALGIVERPKTTSEKSRSDSFDSTVAWLNCDEQYLPETLRKVNDFFRVHPEVDILFGGMLMVDADGNLLSCRKAMPMRRLFLEASYLYNFSCAMFFRQSCWEKLGGFDTSFRNTGDENLIRRAVTGGAKTAVLNEYLATFTYAGNNLSSDPVALEEHDRLKGWNFRFLNALRMPVNLLRLAEKGLRGGFRQTGPIDYEIYRADSPQRHRFVCENPSCKWPEHSKPYLLSHRLKR